MTRLDFLVEGSKGDEYHIIFERTDDNLNIYCSCKAGQNGLYCKHRLALMEGIVDDLVSENEDDVGQIPFLIAGTDVETAYRRLSEIEQIHDEIKKKLNDAKQALARAMRR